jgi:hypothetical protein
MLKSQNYFVFINKGITTAEGCSGMDSNWFEDGQCYAIYVADGVSTTNLPLPQFPSGNHDQNEAK